MISAALQIPRLFSGKLPRPGHPLLDIFRSPDLRRLLPGLALAACLYNLVALALPMSILQIIDRVLANQSVETLAFLVAGVLAALLVEEFLRGVNGLVTGWLGARFEHAASITALDRLLRVPARAFRRDEPSVHAERIVAAGRVAEFYSGQALLVVLDLPFVALFLVAIYLIGGWVAVVPLALLFIFTGVMWRFGGWIREQLAQRQARESRRFNFLQEVFTGIHSIKTLAMEPQMERRHDLLLAANAGSNERLAYGNAMASATGLLFSQAMVVSVVFAGGWGVLAGEMTPGGLAACMMLSVRALQPLRRAFAMWLRYQSFLSAHARLREIAALPWRDDAGKPPLEQVREALELADVTVGEPGREPLLRGVSLRVRVGECVAIRGDSGSGKSTLLLVMNGLEVPEQGAVRVDAHPLDAFAGDSVRRQIALLPQKGTIFTGTVLENLTMFDPAATDAALTLSREIGLDAIVAQMRMGYHTPLGEGNVETLPAGVRQLISIVRSLVHEPRVILFDEANSSLDMESDRRLRAFLAARKARCALVMVTHRPSMLSLADRTLFLSRGRLQEQPPAAPAAHVAGTDAPARERPAVDNDLYSMVCGHFVEETDLARCLLPMLDTLRWKGSTRELNEALPRLLESMDLSAYCAVMANLGYVPQSMRGRLDRLDPRLVPCLFVPRGRPAQVVKALLPDGRVDLHDGGDDVGRIAVPDAATGEIVVFRPREPALARTESAGFFVPLVRRFRAHLALTLVLTAAGMGIALAPPLFVKSVYDHVLPTGDIPMQGYLFLGVAIALAVDFLLRQLRGRVMAYVAGRAEFIVGTRIFHRILGLPASATENASVNRQVGRIRSFESLRDFFLGPLALLVFDLPSSVILIVALGLFNPVALLAVAAGAIAFVLLGLASRGAGERAGARASRLVAERRELLDETLTQASAVRSTGSRAVCVERFRALSARAVVAAFRDQQHQARVNAAAQVLANACGLLALAVSAYAAIKGELSGGAMIATMMIVWRVTGPLQNFFQAASALGKIRNAAMQIENLMRLTPESVERTYIQGDLGRPATIELSRVSFRYAQDADPALLGVTLQAASGELVVITGPSGSGKSTLLKLLTRAFTPQAGSIRLDGVDVRQVSAPHLRSRLTYMPQNCDLFFGTVAQNLRFAHPAAAQRELHWAVEMAGLDDDIRALPDGLQTRISNSGSERLPNGFRQRIALARALLKPASVAILDEPGTGLDEAGEAALQRCVEWLRGRATLLIVSHRPAHMRSADKVVYLERGSIAALGTFEQIKDRLAAGALG